MDEVLNIDLSGLPEGLQKIFRVIQVKGALAAPAVFKAAMKWVWEQEKEYVPQVKPCSCGMSEAQKLIVANC